MTDPHVFRPRRKRPAVYFNDGHCALWIQADSDGCEGKEKLIEAIRAGCAEFWKNYHPKKASKQKVKT